MPRPGQRARFACTSHAFVRRLGTHPLWLGLPATCSTSSPSRSTRGGSSGCTARGATPWFGVLPGWRPISLTAALALWRGPNCADVRDSGLLAREASRLDELRIAALEERIEADLLLGRHSALVAELERLVAEEPLRERLWRQLVTALHHSQRQADALAAYRRARRILADRLGVDPSEELQEPSSVLFSVTISALSPRLCSATASRHP